MWLTKSIYNNNITVTCPSGCDSGDGDLHPASQASWEDSCSAHWERQHQHRRECSAALSSWWVLPPAPCLSVPSVIIVMKWFSSVCFPSGIDLIAAFYGCLYAGCVPVNVRPPHPQNLAATLPTVRMIIDVSACGYMHLCLFFHLILSRVSFM